MSITVDGKWIWLFFVMVIVGAIMNAERFAWVRRIDNFIRTRSILTALIITGSCIAILMLAIFRSRPDGKLHVWWLDVGHSHAVFIETPGGSHILVDGGQYPSRLLTSIGDRMPFYDRTIELVVITHPDEFDTQAVSDVLQRYRAGSVLINGQPNLGESYAQLEEAIAPYDVVTVRAGYTVEIDDGTLIEVLHPAEAPALNNNLNDSVIVLRITYGEVSFLLTSDLSVPGQISLLENGQWPLSTVMALPQHATQRSLSETFLAAVQPQAVVLQSDIANRLGDPDNDTLAMLGGIPVYRTDKADEDEAGTLHFYTDGSALWFVSEN